MRSGKGSADVVDQCGREVVPVIECDEIDVFAQSCVAQMGSTEGSTAEEDHFVPVMPADCCQDVRDGMVAPNLLFGDAELAHHLGQVGCL